MENVLRHCIRKYGFSAVQNTLTYLANEYKVFYEGELAFLQSLPVALELQQPQQQQPQQPQQQQPQQPQQQPVAELPPTPPPTPAQPPMQEIKVVQITEKAAAKAEESMDAKEFTLEAAAAPEGSKRKMKKVIHKNGRVIPVKAEPVSADLEEEAAPAPAPAPVQPVPVNEFVEPTTQVQTIAQRKTPGEIKKWQRAEEAARRAYMKKNKISRSSLMTVENMRQWLSQGQTYAWIAREQLGCKEEDVSKFARENGLQRKKN